MMNRRGTEARAVRGSGSGVHVLARHAELGRMDLDRLRLGAEGADAEAEAAHAELLALDGHAHQVAAHSGRVVGGTLAHDRVGDGADAGGMFATTCNDAEGDAVTGPATRIGACICSDGTLF